MVNNLVSIIMPSYNSALTIERSIVSVLEQGHVNWELLITDDCSTDNTVDIVNGFSKKILELALLLIRLIQAPVFQEISLLLALWVNISHFWMQMTYGFLTSWLPKYAIWKRRGHYLLTPVIRSSRRMEWAAL